MAEYFEVAATMPGKSGTIDINGRKIKTVLQAPGVVWFDFFAICGDGRAQTDYLELVREYHTILVSNIPVLEVRHGAEARRFTWLVDVCYDHRVKLIISAATNPDDLYVEGPNAHEFSAPPAASPRCSRANTSRYRIWWRSLELKPC